MIRIWRVVLMIDDTNGNEVLDQPHDGTRKRVGCVNPLRLPPPSPVQDPKKEEDVLQLLPPASLDEPNSLHLDARTGGLKVEVPHSAGAEEENFPSPFGKYLR